MKIEAVIFEMDGVLTETASLHEQAWQSTFDALFDGNAEQESLSHEDYLKYLDGKPRYHGAAELLTVRGIELPRGAPEDSPSLASICGLGNLKNQRFQRLLDQQGAHVFDDVLPTLQRYQTSGLALACISSSKNCRTVLRNADLESRFGVIVDGELAARDGLNGKPALVDRALQLLGVPAERSLLFEDTEAGVRAGKECSLARVVGVSRDRSSAEQLSAAGADEVSTELSAVRFSRDVPHLFSHWPSALDSEQLILFLDFDGTLSPIVEDPAVAALPADTKRELERAAERYCITVISGRDREDVQRRVGVEGLIYAGNHGLDIEGRDKRFIAPEAEDALAAVREAEAMLAELLSEVPGALLEKKRFSVAAHVRQVRSDEQASAIEARAVEAAKQTGLRLRRGKKVYELEPALDWHKGRAVGWILSEVLGVSPGSAPVAFVGDDETDEDAFRSMAGWGLGIHVGPNPTNTLGHYRVDSPDQVRELLERLR